MRNNVGIIIILCLVCVIGWFNCCFYGDCIIINGNYGGGFFYYCYLIKWLFIYIVDGV